MTQEPQKHFEFDPLAASYAAFALIESLIDSLYDSGVLSQHEKAKIIRTAISGIQGHQNPDIKKGADLIDIFWPGYAER